MKRDELTKFLDAALNIAAFSEDCSNNGVQVEGCDEVRKAVFAVDASQALFDAAVERDGHITIPTGEFVIESGDQVFVAGDQVSITSLLKKLQ